MNERMIYLISLIVAATQKINVPQVYSQRFKSSGNVYYSPTEKIRIDDLTDHFLVAGLVDRNEILPLLGKDGFNTLEFEPDVIGGQFQYQPSDLLMVGAGVPLYTKDGKEITSIQALEAKYAKMAAAAITNKFERQAADAYLKGTYTDKAGKTYDVGVKTAKTLNWTGKIKSDELIALQMDFVTKHSIAPKIEVGLAIFNSLKNEANDTRQNINAVKFNAGDEPSLTVGNLKVELLKNAKGADGKLIDTKNSLILSDTSILALGYGCLTYGDVKTNESKLVRSDLVAGELAVEVTTGSKGLWAKSAPMPVLLSTTRFNRYTITL